MYPKLRSNERYILLEHLIPKPLSNCIKMEKIEGIKYFESLPHLLCYLAKQENEQKFFFIIF